MVSLRLLVTAISLTSALAGQFLLLQPCVEPRHSPRYSNLESLTLPSNLGAPYAPSVLDFSGTETDASTIAHTIAVVEQKATTPPDAVPEHSLPNTVVTAIDDILTGADVVNITTASTGWSPTTAKRRRSVISGDFQEVFTGTGTTAEARDCAIEGTSYQTYKLVPNATYSTSKVDCISFCASVDSCGEFSPRSLCRQSMTITSRSFCEPLLRVQQPFARLRLL